MPDLMKRLAEVEAEALQSAEAKEERKRQAVAAEAARCSRRDKTQRADLVKRLRYKPYKRSALVALGVPHVDVQKLSVDQCDLQLRVYTMLQLQSVCSPLITMAQEQAAAKAP